MDVVSGKKGRGGKRVGAGRKALTPQRARDQAEQREQILLDELIFSGVCTAFHADKGQWNERILSFELSASQIRDAYGHAGLREWRTYSPPSARVARTGSATRT
jgi:hypothetical protein